MWNFNLLEILFGYNPSHHIITHGSPFTFRLTFQLSPTKKHSWCWFLQRYLKLPSQWHHLQVTIQMSTSNAVWYTFTD